MDRPRPQWPSASRPDIDVGEIIMPTHPQPVEAALNRLGQAIPRSAWTRSGPLVSRVQPMNRIDRITIHHEGWTPVWFSDRRSTASRLEKIRRVHTKDRGWGDIGYHYVIDRGGLVWEGRNHRYQGAHVRGYNQHNIGLMVLGNFDRQSPTRSQIQALTKTLRDLMHAHGVPISRVMTHRELNPTACPGRRLQSRVQVLRRSRHLI